MLTQQPEDQLQKEHKSTLREKSQLHEIQTELNKYVNHTGISGYLL
jgi:hypothetical protein